MANLSFFIPLPSDEEADIDQIEPLIRAAALKRGVEIPTGTPFVMTYGVNGAGLYGLRLDHETATPCPVI